MVSQYLLCYDIADPKRLAKVYKKAKEFGLHLQYSVFFCKLSFEQLKGIKALLADLIEEGEDDVRIYPLPADSLVEVMGVGDRIPKGVYCL